MGREKLNCEAVAREASVDPTVRSGAGAVMCFSVVLIESRTFGLQHHWSVDADTSRKEDVSSFSLKQFLERNSAVNYQQFVTLAAGEMGVSS